MTPPRKRLGEMLLEAGVIDHAGLTSALAHQRQWGVRLGQALVELKIAKERDIVQALSRKLGIDLAVLDGLAGREFEAAQALVPRDFAAKNNVIPMSDDGTVLTVAMSDPGNLAAIDELTFRTGRKLKVTIGGDREIAAAIRKVYGMTNPRMDAIALDESDESATAIMPLVGHEQTPEQNEWLAPPLRAQRHAPSLRHPGDDERQARDALLGAVPSSGFDVEHTAEVELPELVSEDILEPEALEPEDDPFAPPPPALAVEPEPRPPASPPAAVPAEPEPSLPSRAAAAVAAIAARGGEDPVLADAARVLAAVLRVLLRKGVLTDREIADELRLHPAAPREPKP